MTNLLKYNQAKMKIFQLVADRQLRIGDRLPPERELVEDFSLSLITVRRAMRELEEERIIERRPRMGTFLRQTLSKMPEFGKMLNIRVCLPDSRDNPACSSMGQKIALELQKRHIRLLHRVTAAPELEIARTASECMGIFVTGNLNGQWRDFLKSLGTPVVVIGGNPFPGVFSNVNYDMCNAAADCHRALLDSGCVRTALVNGGRTYLQSVEIHRGFMKAAQERGLAPGSLPVLWPEPAEIGGSLMRFLREHPDLDGVLLESGALDAMLGCLWQTNYNRDLKISVILDNRNAVRPFSTVRNGIGAYFDRSIPLLAVERMLEQLDASGRRVTTDLIRPKLYHQSGECNILNLNLWNLCEI